MFLPIHKSSLKKQKLKVDQKTVAKGDENIINNETIVAEEVNIYKDTPGIDDKQKNRKIIQVTINRILDDASDWLQKTVKQHETNSKAITNDFYNRNVNSSGEHITAHINNVNNFIDEIDNYATEKINRAIEDLLLNEGEEDFKSTSWTTDEYQKCLTLIDKFKKVKNVAKEQNNKRCSRFTDKATLDHIIKINPYKK